MDNLNINLKLYGNLNKYIKNYDHKKGVTLRLDSNWILIDVVTRIGIPENRISLILAGDKIVSLNYRVKNNDIIKIFSQIGGG